MNDQIFVVKPHIHQIEAFIALIILITLVASVWYHSPQSDSVSIDGCVTRSLVTFSRAFDISWSASLGHALLPRGRKMPLDDIVGISVTAHGFPLLHVTFWRNFQLLGSP